MNSLWWQFQRVGNIEAAVEIGNVVILNCQLQWGAAIKCTSIMRRLERKKGKSIVQTNSDCHEQSQLNHVHISFAAHFRLHVVAGLMYVQTAFMQS